MEPSLATGPQQRVLERILQGYGNYRQEFDEITARARDRFNDQDWPGIQADSRERLKLYKQKYRGIAAEVKQMLGEAARDKALWRQIKQAYAEAVAHQQDFEIAETFFNSVCRKVFNHMAVDDTIMFILPYPGRPHFEPDASIYNEYKGRYTARDLTRQILTDYQPDAPFEDLDRDVEYVVKRIKKHIIARHQPGREAQVQVLKPLFYRNKGAYIVGRAIIRGQYIPFLLPLLHEDGKIYVDTLILNPNDVSIIFSFTRSYFMAEVETPSAVVRFLHTLMPQKATEELYNSIGFNKHGKTELYRSFLEHLATTDDPFEMAPGIRGMVMTVFTLPNYQFVFKVIKDAFKPPKTMSKAEVKAKYKLVSEHDRVGRMADTHEFVNIEFDKKRFSPELLEELRTECGSILTEAGDRLTINHLYTERKMIPLNLYLEEATPKEAKEAVSEYGNAIKQLAAANIFPGDMLLKNFGVTRHRRVVFYDYDEICFLTQCCFRRIPEPASYEEELACEPYFSVGENDIFPEEFRQFLIGYEAIRALFFQLHDDIFDVKFWKQMQDRINRGEVVDVFPYRRKKRFPAHR